MEQPQPNLEPINLLQIFPEAMLVQLDQRLIEFAEVYNLPANMVEALRPENAVVLACGLPAGDRLMLKRYVSNLSLALDILDRDLQALGQNPRPFNPIVDDRDGRLRRNVTEEAMQEAGGDTWWHTLEITNHSGLEQSALLCLIVESVCASSAHLFASELPNQIVELEESDAVFLTGLATNRHMSKKEVAKQLADKGLGGLDRQTLEGRLQLWQAAAHLELTRLLVHDMMDFNGLMKLQGVLVQDNSSVAARKIRLSFVEESLIKRLFLLKEGADLFKVTSIAQKAETRENWIGEVLEKMEQRLHSVIVGFTWRHGLFKRMLEQLEQLELLRSEQEHAAEMRRVAETAKQRQQEERRASHKRYQEAHKALSTEVEGANRPWKITGGVVKTEYRSLRNGLSKGVQLPQGGEAAVNVYDGQVTEAIGILAGLDALAARSQAETGELEQAKTELAAALAWHSALGKKVDSLYLEMKKQGAVLADTAYPNLISLAKHLEHMRAQWPALEKLIIVTWPEKQAREVAARIGQLLV